MIIIGCVVNGAVINLDALPLLYKDTEEMNGSARLFPDTFQSLPNK